MQTAKWGFRHIAVGGIPLLVALKEYDLMASRFEGPGKGSVCGRMPVSPGRSNRQSKDNDFQMNPRQSCSLSMRVRQRPGLGQTFAAGRLQGRLEFERTQVIGVIR